MDKALREQLVKTLDDMQHDTNTLKEEYNDLIIQLVYDIAQEEGYNIYFFKDVPKRLDYTVNFKPQDAEIVADDFINSNNLDDLSIEEQRLAIQDHDKLYDQIDKEISNATLLIEITLNTDLDDHLQHYPTREYFDERADMMLDNHDEIIERLLESNDVNDALRERILELGFDPELSKYIEKNDFKITDINLTNGNRAKIEGFNKVTDTEELTVDGFIVNDLLDIACKNAEFEIDIDSATLEQVEAETGDSSLETDPTYSFIEGRVDRLISDEEFIKQLEKNPYIISDDIDDAIKDDPDMPEDVSYDQVDFEIDTVDTRRGREMVADECEIAFADGFNGTVTEWIEKNGYNVLFNELGITVFVNILITSNPEDFEEE